MRLRLHRELDRAGTLADPGLLKMALQMDRLIVEEMKRTLPDDKPAVPVDEQTGEESIIMLWRG